MAATSSLVSGTIQMKVKSIPSSLIGKNGRRFDCNPYLSGAIEAQLMLNSLQVDKMPLNSLTAGYNGGIYNGPVFKRRFVDSKDYGVPFLTSGNMLRTDLFDLQYLSEKDARSKKLSYLELKAGMIMISCSGAIGNMVYVRDDLEGYWSCQDQLKVVADTDKISSGYLYAFLGSKYGLPIIVSGTYGAIIQHLEPVHIESIPVPRFNFSLESEIHDLVCRAAELRSKASLILKNVSTRFDELITVAQKSRSMKISATSSKTIQ
jgi:type I restriction enzyme S subunit